MCAIDRPSPFLRRHFMFFFLRFRGSLKGCLMPWQSDYWRSGCHPLGGVFSRLLCALGFPFYLGPLSPVYLLAAAQGLAAYSCFTTQSFWYSLKDLFAQLSASTSSLVVSLYSWVWVLLFHSFTASFGELGFLFEFWDPVLRFGSVCGVL